MQVGQPRQHRHAGRIGLPGIGQDGRGSLKAVLALQERRIAQRRVHRPARNLDRQCQPFPRKIHCPVAFMCFGHQGQYLWIAGCLFKSRAQIKDGVAGTVFCNQPSPAHFQRFNHRAVFGQNFFDPGAGTDAVSIGFKHPCQHHLDAPGLIRRGGRSNDGFHLGQGRIFLSGGEIKPGPQRAVDIGVGGAGIGSDQLVQFGPCRIRAARRLQKLDHREVAVRCRRRRARQTAQKRLGPIGIATGQIPVDQRRAHVWIVGKAVEHGLQQCADPSYVLCLRKKLQL